MGEIYNEVRGRHAVKILERMHSFYEASVLCNFELVVGNDRIPVHKLILITNSDYFKSKLTDITSEIILEDCQEILSKTVKMAIEFFYLGEIDMDLHQVPKVIEFAKVIQADKLEKYCLDYLEKITNTENFLFIEKYAKQNGYLQLLDQTKTYVTNNYLEIIQKEQFLNMSRDRLGELLQSDYLKVTTEEQAFQGLKIWIQMDIESRKIHLNTLLKYIRLPLLSVQFLLQEVKPLCYSSSSSELMWDILEWYQNPKTRSCLSLLNSTPRMSAKQTILIVGGNSIEISGEVETYDNSVERWSTFYNLNNKNRWFQAVILDSKLITIGGNVDGVSTNKVYCLDLASKQTTELKEMLQARELFKATVVNGQVFVFGGRDVDNDVDDDFYDNFNDDIDAHILKSTERYDPASNSWISLAPMLSNRYNHEIAAIANEIYIIGGQLDGANYVNTMEVYNINQNKWTVAPPMKEKRGNFAAVTLGDHIYAIGGYNGTSSYPNSVERFDVKSQTWTYVEKYPQSKCDQKAVAFNDKIICVGGNSSSLFEYDPSTDKWTSRGSISQCRTYFNILLAPMDLLKIE
ncbi:kelch-like protein 12 [Arctopsyche grandis]|uniref:kelch-like protein 12 n=1 Tax=Arctopsyche grandis TaxID=121162 RepID=UPI00406DA362